MHPWQHAHWQGLSTLGTLSHRQGYTYILFIPTWKKPADCFVACKAIDYGCHTYRSCPLLQEKTPACNLINDQLQVHDHLYNLIWDCSLCRAHGYQQVLSVLSVKTSNPETPCYKLSQVYVAFPGTVELGNLSASAILGIVLECYGALQSTVECCSYWSMGPVFHRAPESSHDLCRALEHNGIQCANRNSLCYPEHSQAHYHNWYISMFKLFVTMQQNNSIRTKYNVTSILSMQAQH